MILLNKSLSRERKEREREEGGDGENETENKTGKRDKYHENSIIVNEQQSICVELVASLAISSMLIKNTTLKQLSLFILITL